MSTWAPRVIDGGGTRPARPPFEWDHADGFPSTAAHVVAVRWWTEDGLERSCIIAIGPEQDAHRLVGTAPDALTLRELAEDVERWHAHEEEIRAGRRVDGTIGGARYHV